jgi:DNA (cytosine-5)-methyltransferase 1
MHLFSGAGGGLLADLILGHEPIIAVEWDRYACQVLRERAADGWFPELRVWEGDIRMFDPSEYAGKVDCIHAGFPCQDISTAGKQAGIGEETRSGLYREVLRILGVVRPRYLFLENVAAITSNGLATVIADLATCGYDAEWLCLRASDCGANHHRDRWWCLAYPKGERGNDRSNHSAKLMERQKIPESGNNGGESDLSYPYGERGCRRNTERQDATATRQPSPSAWEYGRRMGDGNIEPELGLLADGVASGLVQECSSSWWETEPEIGRVAKGMNNRNRQLKALGNGQVPLQAAVAWKLLGGE